MKILHHSIYKIFILLLMSCNPSNEQAKLMTGDILFREALSTKISKAIDQVTQTGSTTHFSHMGLVEIVDGEPRILHASPDGGTCIVSLDKFVHPREDSVHVVIYRLKPEYRHAIPAAIAKAKSMLEKPYNFSYILNDSAHYCSEFVFRAFDADSIFELNPMTFKDPKTGEFSKSWIDYYEEMGLEIPEGLPGCNPNGMAASEKLIRIGNLER